MIEATCHCQNVIIAFAQLPVTLTSCNCSLCRRYGALWGYYSSSDITFFIKRKVIGYAQGDKTLDAYHCDICGCLTHYISNSDSRGDLIGVNFRMVKPSLIAQIPIRYFDGADTWKYLND